VYPLTHFADDSDDGQMAIYKHLWDFNSKAGHNIITHSKWLRRVQFLRRSRQLHLQVINEKCRLFEKRQQPTHYVWEALVILVAKLLFEDHYQVIHWNKVPALPSVKQSCVPSDPQFGYFGPHGIYSVSKLFTSVIMGEAVGSDICWIPIGAVKFHKLQGKTTKPKNEQKNFDAMSAQRQNGPVDEDKIKNPHECIVCDLDNEQRERACQGLLYTATSRATTLGDIKTEKGSATHFCGLNFHLSRLITEEQSHVDSKRLAKTDHEFGKTTCDVVFGSGGWGNPSMMNLVGDNSQI
jgi:hypothetical protein